MAELINASVNTLGSVYPESVSGFTEALVTSGMIPRLASFDEPPLVPEPISLEQAKIHLNLQGVIDDNDAMIQGLIVAARQMAEGRTNRTITQRVREQAFSNWYSMRLLKPPFVQVESVSYFDAEGNEQTLDSSSYTVSTRREPASIALTGAARYSAPSLAAQDEAVIVRYTAGYPVGEVPAPIVQWMLLQIGSMYEHRESVIAGVSVTTLPEMYERMFLQTYMVYE